MTEDKKMIIVAHRLPSIIDADKMIVMGDGMVLE